MSSGGALSSSPADALARLDRRPKLFFATATLGILLLVLTFSILDLWAIRRRTLDLAEKRALNVSVVLSEYIREIFLAGDTSVRQLAVYSDRAGGPAAPAAEWQPILMAARAALTGIGSLSVTDADGIIRHSSQRLILGESRRDEYSSSDCAPSPPTSWWSARPS